MIWESLAGCSQSGRSGMHERPRAVGLTPSTWWIWMSPELEPEPRDRDVQPPGTRPPLANLGDRLIPALLEVLRPSVAA